MRNGLSRAVVLQIFLAVVLFWFIQGILDERDKERREFQKRQEQTTEMDLRLLEQKMGATNK